MEEIQPQANGVSGAVHILKKRLYTKCATQQLFLTITKLYTSDFLLV